jgi:predicted acyl esterase
MIIAGWADGYRNNTFRVIEQYERNGLPWRLLAGPWVHKSPDVARPGPNVDDDVDIIAFFDEHLRGGPAAQGARGQVFVRRPVVPEPDLALHPGVWRDIDAWPPEGLREVEFRAGPGGVESLVVRGDVGVAAWNSCGGALPWGQPLDQRGDNARSINLDWPIEESAELVGNGRVALRVRADHEYGHVSVKLCDVFPDGTSALITRGMLDLTHVGCWPADAHGEVGRRPAALTPGEWIEAEIGLEATTWTLQPGHTLRLAVAGTDWPNCWPPPGPVTLELDRDATMLILPIVAGLPETAHAFTTGAGPSDTDGDGAVWRIEHDVLDRETRVVTRYGGTYEGNHGAVVTDDYRGELGVSTIDPAIAWARGSSSLEIRWPEATVRTEASLSIRSDREALDVELTLVAHEGDEEIGRRAWTRRLPR